MLKSIARGLIIANLITYIPQSNTVSFATKRKSINSNIIIKNNVNKCSINNVNKVVNELNEYYQNNKIYTFKISYYTSLESCCGKSDAITASGKIATYGMVALPSDIPFGSKVILNNENHRTFICEDRGGAIQRIDDKTIKMDIFIPRNEGENDSQYLKRVRDYGIDTVEGFLILND